MPCHASLSLSLSLSLSSSSSCSLIVSSTHNMASPLALSFFARPSSPLLSHRRPLSATPAVRAHKLRQQPTAEQLHELLLDRRPPASELDAFASNTPNRPYYISQPELNTTIARLLSDSGVVPVSTRGDLDVPVTGVQNDSRKVSPGDLFVCCVGQRTDGHLYAADAAKRGAVAVLVSGVVDVGERSGCRAVIVVEDTNSVLPALAAALYGHPSKRMSVVGITGTNGKTTTAHLVKAVHEAMALRVGMLGTIGYFLNGGVPMEAPNTTPDAVTVQKLMAEMVRDGTEAVVMEASSHGLALGRCEEIDFNVAVFMNLTRDHYDFHKTEEDYRDSKAKLFEKMVDPRRHRKVVNIDDPNAPFFIARGNVDVPLVTFGMENMDADVYPLMFKLSLFGIEVLISTPKGVAEIHSRLIGRHNIYNILAAAAVGVAVGAPLEDIVRGIERVDGVPGRCELIDEGQPFAVVVDFAHTPDALAKVLGSAKELGAKRIITVFGCAGESDNGKRPLMTKIAADKSDVVILTSDNPKTESPFAILDEMLAGVGWTIQEYVQYCKNGYCPPLTNGHKLFVHDMRRVAMRAAIAMAEKGDIVIVAGRGHETHQLEGNKKKYIDDREECREALCYVDKLHRAGMDKCIPMLVARDSLFSFCQDVGFGFAPINEDDPSLILTAH